MFWIEFVSNSIQKTKLNWCKIQAHKKKRRLIETSMISVHHWVNISCQSFVAKHNFRFILDPVEYQHLLFNVDLYYHFSLETHDVKKQKGRKREAKRCKYRFTRHVLWWLLKTTSKLGCSVWSREPNPSATLPLELLKLGSVHYLKYHQNINQRNGAEYNRDSVEKITIISWRI